MDEALAAFLRELAEARRAAEARPGGPAGEPEGARPGPAGHPSRPAVGEEGDVLTRFWRRWRENGGRGTTCDSGDLVPFLRDVFARHGCARAVRWRTAALDELFGPEEEAERRFGCRVVPLAAEGPRRERLAATADADAGVVVADFAVAATGSVVHRVDGVRLPSVSLLPPVLVALVPAGAVVEAATAVWEAVRRWTRLGSGAQWISGPSRSSDIENEPTEGVHGPGVVYAVVVRGWATSGDGRSSEGGVEETID